MLDETIDVTSNDVQINGAVVTIQLSVAKVPGTAYHVKIDPTAFVSFSDRQFIGIADNTTWKFYTAGGEGVFIIRHL